MTPWVRKATPADAEAACAVIRRSIAESCIEDHHRDPAVLAAWLANKTPESVRSWIASPDAFGVVAESDGAIVGFAMLTVPGEISLCYLVPEAQGLGIGRAMLTTLEDEAARRHVAELTLRSTESAHRFYLRLGFVDSSPARRGRFITAQPHAQGADAIGTERLACS
jgi:GNAT superfamily N-acetyltransferase